MKKYAFSQKVNNLFLKWHYNILKSKSNIFSFSEVQDLGFIF